MINRNQIHTFTSNFPNLQGLKAIPVGMLLLMIVIWSNQQTGNTRDLTLPLIIAIAMGVFYWFVDQYYKLSFGSVEQTRKKKSQNLIISLVAAGLGLVSFIVDSANILSVSLMGLLWALLLVFDGVRIRRSLPGKTFPFFWVFALLIVFISLLPLFGLSDWWLEIGIQDQANAILMLVSIISIVSGFLWHSFLTKNLAIRD